MAQLLAALSPDTDRDVAVISAIGGLGGVGKTALALHVAHAVQPRFPGGVLFVDMRGYGDSPVAPEQAALSLLRALGIRDEDLPPTPESWYAFYRSELARREPVLLVLDNVCRPQQVAPLLPGASKHRVLVTSRETLHSLPARLISIDSLAEDEAVELIERSLLVSDPDDCRGSQEPEAVRQLVRLCGCLPLALQIAAAQLRHYRRRLISSLAADLQAAADRVRELCTPGVDQYGRELALRPIFDVTYRRLGTGHARLFRLLAHTPGPDFSHESAAIVSDQPAGTVLDQLHDLASAFLITPSSTRDRWEMHDLLRAYAQSLSSVDPVLVAEAARARDRLLTHFLSRTLAADKHLQGLLLDEAPDLFATRDDAVAWLDAERTALVGAALWVERAEHSRTAPVLALALDRYLYLRRHFSDSEAIAIATRRFAQLSGDNFLEATAWQKLGSILHEIHRFREGAIAHTHALRIFYALEDRSGQASAWTNLGRCMHELHQLDIAARMHQHAQKLFSQLGEQHREAMAWNNLGITLRELRRPGNAAQAHRKALDTFVLLGDRQREATAWINLGASLGDMGDSDAAANSYMTAADIFSELGDRHGVAKAWNNTGIILLEHSHFDASLHSFQICESICAELEDWHGTAGARRSIADLYDRVGAVHEARAARESADEALALADTAQEASEDRHDSE